MSVDRKCVGAACEIKNADAGEVTAVVATLGVVDRDGDVLLPGSFPATAAVKISAYAHDVVVDAVAPVGKGTVRVEGGRAILRGKYFLTTTAGREAFATVKELGAEGEWSFGFPREVTVAPMTEEWRAKGARRLISRILPIEASPVFRGAGVGTHTVSAKCDACAAHEVVSRSLNSADLTRTLAGASDDEWWRTHQKAIATLRADPDYDPWPADRRKFAERVFRFACAWLDIEEPRPVVRGFAPDGKRWGRFDAPANEVRFDVSQSDDELVHTAFHEAWHVVETRWHWPPSEVAAEATGRWGLERWHERATA